MEHPFFTRIYYSCKLASFQSLLFQQVSALEFYAEFVKGGEKGWVLHDLS